MSNIKKAAIEFYLDWDKLLTTCQSLTPESMAYHYNMTTQQCSELINMGREWHADQAVKNSDATL